MFDRDVICVLLKNPLVQNRNVIILQISGFYWNINTVLLNERVKTSLGIHLETVLIENMREKW